jgi:hypothetical protein
MSRIRDPCSGDPERKPAGGPGRSSGAMLIARAAAGCRRGTIEWSVHGADGSEDQLAGFGSERSTSTLPWRTKGLRSATHDQWASVPVSIQTSHTRAVLSSLAVTTRVPSGLNTAFTTLC